MQPDLDRHLTARSPAPRLVDIASQILLPRLFRAGAVAARPERVFVGTAMAICVVATIAVFNAGGAGNDPLGVALDQARFGLSGIGPDLVAGDIAGLSGRARSVLITAPGLALGSAPVRSVGVVLIAALLWGTAGVFIARGAAFELGRSLHIGLSASARFLLVKGPAAVGALLFVPIVVGLLLLGPLLLGLLLSVPGLDVLSGVLYGLGLVFSALAAFLLLVWFGAFWMIVPAVASDGADVFDAIQRAYGVLLAKPLGVLTHLLVAAAQGVILTGFVLIVADLAVGLAGVLAGGVSETAGAILSGATEDLEGGTRRAASWMVAVWNRVPLLLAAGYAVSYAHTAGTAVYLNARKMVDGQEPSELWMPGDAAGIVEIEPGEQAAGGDG